MQTQIAASFLALMSLAACASTSSGASSTTASAESAQTPKLMRVGKVDFHTDTAIVAFPVRDLAASKSWYERVLGAKVVYEVPEQRWCEISTPAEGTLIGLHEQAGATAGPANALGMGVVDMDAARAHLVANGVKLEQDVFEIPGIVKLLHFLDPDGNRMWFYAPAG